MAGESKLELLIAVEAKQANAALKSVNGSILGLEQEAARTSVKWSGGMDAMASSTARSMRKSGSEMETARQTAQLLAQTVGISLPEAATKWITSLKGMAPLLMSAFSSGAIIAIGIALFNGTKKLYDWATGSEAAAKAAKEQREETEKLTKSIEDHYAKMQALERAGGLIGLSGSARAAQEARNARADVEKARIEYEGILGKYNRLYLDAQKYTVRGGQRQLTPQAQQALAEFDAVQEEMLKRQEAYEEAKKALANQGKESEITAAQEIAKAHEDARKKTLDSWSAMIDAHKAAANADYENIKKANAESDKAHQDAIASWTQLAQARVEEHNREIARIREVASTEEQLSKGNTDLQRQIYRLQGNRAAILAADIEALDKQREEYAQYADVVAAIDERKKLLIMQNDQEIANEARNQFERTAQSIEGFFQRVFLTARSFTDVWKQLWTQATGYLISMVARTVAASLMGVRTVAGAGVGGGGGLGGMLGGMIPMIGGGGGMLSTGGINPNAGGGAGGSLLGLGGLGASLAGLKGFLGFGGQGANLQGMLAGGSGFSWSGLAHSNAALLGGGMLAAYGLKRGGLSGMAMTTAGGAMMGFKFGGPLGAAIGGAIGLGAGIARLFIKGASDKAREKVRSVYGVDIPDKGILNQIVEMARQGFGGNLDMAIRSQQVRDIVDLYAQMTGQSTARMPAKMSAGMYAQSGGSIYSVGSGGFSSLPGAGLDRIGPGSASGGGPMVINISIPGAKQFFEQETTQIILNNPRAVQTATMSATRANAGRRQLTSLQISPGTITS